MLQTTNYLPKELWGSIFVSLPEYEKNMVLPLVCQVWRAVSADLGFGILQFKEQLCHKTIDKFSIKNLEASSFPQAFSFIPRLKKISRLSFKWDNRSSVRNTPFLPEFKCSKALNELTEFGSCTIPIAVNWTPDLNNYTPTRSGKWGGLYCNFELRAISAVYTDKLFLRQPVASVTLNHSFNIGIRRPINLGKNWIISRTFFGDKKVDSMPFRKQLATIEKMFKASVKTYVWHMATINLPFLKFLPFKPGASIEFNCDQHGLLNSSIKEQKHTFKLTLLQLESFSEMKIETLKWEALEYYQDKTQLDFTTLLRWCVLSESTNLLIKELGLTSLEKLLNRSECQG